MFILIIIIGLITGIILNYLIEKITSNIAESELRIESKLELEAELELELETELKAELKKESTIRKLIVPIICAAAFEILFLRLGVNSILVRAMALTAILVTISVVDIKKRIIPDFMIYITLVVGIIFTLIIKTSLTDMILGMIFGGGILFLLALIPNAMGGGDVKLMFAVGSYLGFNRTLWALMLAFVLSSVISIALVLTKIKDTKDYIPFGPFLSLGSFISLLIFL